MKTESEYLFVEVASMRCLQLMRGAKPKIESSARKYTTLAIDEVSQGLVPWKILSDEEETLVTSGLQERVDDEAAPVD